MVSAPAVTKERGIKVTETKTTNEQDYQTLLRVTVESESGKTSVAGTLFSGRPRIVAIDDVKLEAEVSRHMLLVRNEDKPGFIGRLGTVFGEAGINIANFMLGRPNPNENAVALVAVDTQIPATMIERISRLDGVVACTSLRF